MVCSQVNFCLMGHVFHQYQATFLPLFTPIIPTYFLASLSSQFFTKPQRNLIRIHEVKMTKAKLIIGAFCPYFYAIYTSVLHVFPTKTEFFDFFCHNCHTAIIMLKNKNLRVTIIPKTIVTICHYCHTFCHTQPIHNK